MEDRLHLPGDEAVANAVRRHVDDLTRHEFAAFVWTLGELFGGDALEVVLEHGQLLEFRGWGAVRRVVSSRTPDGPAVVFYPD